MLVVYRMITINLLELHDIITGDCFSRCLETTQEPWSDYVPSTSYGGSPINRYTWTEVERTHPAWIGATVQEYKKQCQIGNDIFCKGVLPKFMITALTEYEFEAKIYKEYLKSNIIQFGKYKGLSSYEIKKKNPEYFEWLSAKTDSITSLSVMYQDYLESY